MLRIKCYIAHYVINCGGYFFDETESFPTKTQAIEAMLLKKKQFLNSFALTQEIIEKFKNRNHFYIEKIIKEF